MTNTQDGECPMCSGKMSVGTTTFTVDYGQGLFIARNVPAEVCDQCGESWITDETAEHLERLLHGAKTSRRQIEVIDMAA